MAVEGDPDGNALRDLNPIAVGILSRDDCELAARAGTDALDVGRELRAWISVDLDARLWPGTILPTSFSLKLASTQAVWSWTSESMPRPCAAI